MQFFHILPAVMMPLQREGRVTYQALKLEFRLDDAHACVAKIDDWFLEGFDTLDLREAKALLEALAL